MTSRFCARASALMTRWGATIGCLLIVLAGIPSFAPQHDPTVTWLAPLWKVLNYTVLVYWGAYLL